MPAVFACDLRAAPCAIRHQIRSVRSLAALEEMGEAAPVLEPQPAATRTHKCNGRSQRSVLVRRAQARAL